VGLSSATERTARRALRSSGRRHCLRFSARVLCLVLVQAATVDGAAPGADHGADIDSEGNGMITEMRLYQLVRQAGDVLERFFEIRFLDQARKPGPSPSVEFGRFGQRDICPVPTPSTWRTVSLLCCSLRLSGVESLIKVTGMDSPVGTSSSFRPTLCRCCWHICL
jgi:Thioredoxin like C-terminal domain